MRSCLAVIFVLLSVAGSVAGAEVRNDLPSTIDPASKYLFYLHGVSVELQGPDSYSRQFRKTYETTAIARALAERGFVVIAESRPRGAKVPEYAGKLATQIRQLLAAGVPGRNIVVVGHSKGGFIAMAAASRTASPEVSFVILAGCPLTTTHDIAGNDYRANYEAFIGATKARIKSRMFSLYDVTDGWMGSCREVFAENPESRTNEIVLQSGLQPGMGHSLFYAPDKIWIDPVIDWITN